MSRFGDTSNDPFLTNAATQNYGATLPGRRKASKGRFSQPLSPSFWKEGFKVLCSAPIAIFFGTSLVFTFSWQLPYVVAAVLLLGVIISAASHEALAPRSNLPAIAGCVAAVSGAFTGLYAHEAYLRPFFAIAYGRAYTNVLASHSAAAYADAGKLFFANTSTVDTSRTVGYRDRRTYCVAPVVDAGAEQTKTIGFWAVGMDCCSARGDFECGGASDANVRGGVPLPPDGLLERSQGDYLAAIRQNAVVYDLTVEEDPVLILWTKDPSEQQRVAILSALGVLVLGVSLFVLLVFFIAAASALASDEGTRFEDGLPH